MDLCCPPRTWETCPGHPSACRSKIKNRIERDRLGKALRARWREKIWQILSYLNRKITLFAKNFSFKFILFHDFWLLHLTYWYNYYLYGPLDLKGSQAHWQICWFKYIITLENLWTRARLANRVCPPAQERSRWQLLTCTEKWFGDWNVIFHGISGKTPQFPLAGVEASASGSEGLIRCQPGPKFEDSI